MLESEYWAIPCSRRSKYGTDLLIPDFLLVSLPADGIRCSCAKQISSRPGPSLCPFMRLVFSSPMYRLFMLWMDESNHRRRPHVLLPSCGPQLVQGDRGWLAEDTPGAEERYTVDPDWLKFDKTPKIRPSGSGLSPVVPRAISGEI